MSYDNKSEENKNKTLQNEIVRLKKAIEETLFQVRLILSDIENPFKYIAKYISDESDEVPVKKVSKDELLRKERDKNRKVVSDAVGGEVEQEGEEAISGVKHDSQERTISPRESSKKSVDIHKKLGHFVDEDLIRDESIKLNLSPEGIYAHDFSFLNFKINDYYKGLLVADFLARIFGKDRLKNILYSFLHKGLIDEYIYFIVLDAVDKLSDDYNNTTYPVKLEDYIIAIYLLNYIKSSDPSIFYIMLLLLHKFYDVFSLASLFGGNPGK